MTVSSFWRILFSSFQSAIKDYLYLIALYINDMKVPPEIRSVERPPNTIVYAYTDKSGNIRYGVKERIYWKEGGVQRQKDGATIGYIEGGTYVGMPEDDIPPISYSSSDILWWGPYRMVLNLSGDIWEDLLKVYNKADAEKIYSLAVLRTVEMDLKDYEAKDAYENSFLSVINPGVALSKDTISDFLFDLGRTCSRISEFVSKRAERVPFNHTIAVDGMLKSYESDSSSLSDFSRKALKTGTRDVSLLVAYDVDIAEPVCARVYPGNMNDRSVFRDFLVSNNICSGLIMTDKGFSYESAKKVFLDNPNLHFLMPLNRNSEVIREYRALYSDHTLDNRSGVSSRKVRMHDGRFLYSFRDSDIASSEEKNWIASHPDYDPAELEELRRSFGSITFVCDLDAGLETIYAAYEERWELEVMFRFYKQILTMDETRVESDQSVIGTEFVNFISVIMMCRLRKRFYSIRSLSKRPFKANMKLLRKGIMIRDSKDSEWRLRQLTSEQEKVFIELGLIERPVVEKKRKGRPLGSKNRPKVQ